MQAGRREDKRRRGIAERQHEETIAGRKPEANEDYNTAGVNGSKVDL